MIENQLKQLGFNKNEIKTYLALFDLGKSKAGEIILYTKLHRNLVYTALDELLNKRLISKVEKNGIFLFEANDPQTIIELIDDKKKIATDTVRELIKKQKIRPSDINIYEGLDGNRRVLDKSIEQAGIGDTLYVMGASKHSNTPEMEKEWKMFHKKRIEKGVGFKILYDKSTPKDVVEWRNNLPITEAKYFPFNIETPVRFRFIKDFLDIGILGDSPVTFTIRSREAVEALKKYFEYFWNQKVSIETGVEALEKSIYEMLSELAPGEEYSVLGASAGDNSGEVQKLYDKFHVDRIKKGVTTKMLVYRESFDRIKKRFNECGDPEGKVSFVKTYTTAPATPMQINLFNNKAFIILYGDEPTIIHFSQSELYAGFKAYFDQLWNQEAITFSGRESVEDAYNSLLDIAKKEEDVIIFAAKPKDPISSEFNVQWAERLSPLCRKIKYIYYGLTDENKKRAEEIRSRVKNSEVQILNTDQSLPISNVVMCNTTLNTVWSDTPVCLVTKNQMVADSLRENFNLLWNQETQVLKGVEVLRDIWLEAIDCKELRWIGARGYFVDRYPEIFKEIKKKAEHTPGVIWKNVIDPGFRGHILTKLPWTETKYNLSSVKNPNAIWLFGNKVLIVNWAEDIPVIFQSTNKQLIQSYSDYFDELWKKGE